MPASETRVFSVEIIGFSPADRTVIASMFALSRRRNFKYEEYVETGFGLVPRRRPDLFLADIDNSKSIVALKSKSPNATHPAVLIGADSHGLEWDLVKRPIKWAELFAALDKSVERAKVAHALIPEEKRLGWPFFDRRKRHRVEPEAPYLPLPDGHSDLQRTARLEAARLAPTVSLLDLDKNNMGEGPGSLPLVRDPAADTVLVVDDDTSARRFLASHLARFGVNIDFATSGEQALGMIARKRYVCVFLDTSLPGIDGYQTCRLIKSVTIQAPSVVLLSEKSNALNRVRGRLAGCDAFLDRQVDFDTLVITLARYAAPRAYATVVTALP
jgi:two-component system cell cycle response regulator